METLKLAQFRNISSLENNQRLEFLKRNINDLNCCDSSGYSYLHFVAEKSDLASMKELIRRKVDLVKQGFEDGKTALHIVSERPMSLVPNIFSSEEYVIDYKGKLKEDKFVNTLLSAQIETGIATNPKSKDGMSHLHIACMYNHVKAVELFLNADESVDYATNDDHQLPGYTALHFAVRYSSFEAAELLLRHGANIHLEDSAGKSALHCIIERLMDIADFLATGKRIYVPLYKQERDILESILGIFLKNKKTKSTLDENGLTLLHVTCTFKNPTAAKNVLGHQNVDLNVAIKSESKFWPGWTPLHFAACFSIEAFKVLLLHGADLNIKNTKGETPLDLCMQRYSPHVAHSILSTKDEYKNIVFTDGSTNLLEIVLLMSNNELFREWLKGLIDVDISVPLDSPIWPGCNLLHLTVMNERIQLNERKNLIVEVAGASWLTRIQHGLLDYWDEIMSILLEKSYNFRTVNADGLSPIFLAVKLRKARSVKKILKSFNINDEDSSGLSYFHIACAIGNLKVMERLAKQEVNCNSPVKCDFEWYISDFSNKLVQIPTGSTPLHIAVITNNEKVLVYLLENNADMFLKDRQGLDPVELSMINGYVNMTRLFLEKMPVSCEFLATDGLQYNLHIAVICDDGEAIEKFLQQGNNPKIWSVFEPACPQLRMRFSNEVGKTPLEIAMLLRHSQAVAALVKDSAHILDKIPDQLLKLAIKHGYSYYEYFISQLKQKEGPAIEPLDKTGVTLLHIATEEYDVDWVKDLLTKGADPNFRVASCDNDDYWDGLTPLDCIVYSTSRWAKQPTDPIEVLELLIEFGADVTIKDNRDKTPIHTLYYEAIDRFSNESSNEDNDASNEDCCKNVMSAIDVLLKAQKTYEINPIDPHGLSHFHLACYRNQLDIVKRFLDCGVDINHAYDPFAEVERHAGYTPIHFALERKNIDVARLLIERGANVKAEDLRGHTPLHVALKQGFVDDGLIELILRHGGDINAKNVYDITPIEYLVMNELFTLQQLNVMLNHGAVIDLISIKPKGSGFIGLAMLNALPEDRLDILYKIIDTSDVKSVIKRDGNIIDSAVNVDQKGLLTDHFYLNVIRWLVDAGCDPDQQDREGKTALHRAISVYNYEAAVALSIIGVNLNVVDKNGESPLTREVINDKENPRRSSTLGFLVLRIVMALRMKLYMKESVKKATFQVMDQLSLPDTSINGKILESRFRQELGKIGMTFINKIPLKNFLSDTNLVIHYSRMPELERQAVDAFFKCRDNIRKDFPRWVGILMMQYRKAVARAEMLKPAMEIIFESGIKLPALCLYEILQYLTYDEVKLLMRES